MKTKTAPTLREKLIFSSYAAVLLPIIVFCVVCYVLLMVNAHRAQEDADRDIINQTSHDANQAINTIENFVLNVAYANQVQQPLQRYANSNHWQRKSQLSETRRSINRFLFGFHGSAQTVRNAMVFAIDGSVVGSMTGYNSQANISDYSWYPALAQSGGESIWVANSQDTHEYWSSGNRLIPVVKKIRNLGGGNAGFAGDLGYLLVYIDADNFTQTFLPQNDAFLRSLYLVEKDNRILGHNSGSFFEGQFPLPLQNTTSNTRILAPDNQYYLFSYNELNHNGWYVACLSRYDAISRDANLALMVCMVVAGILLVVLYQYAARSARPVVEFIQNLRAAFHTLEKGDFTPSHFPVSNISELDDLNHRYTLMANRLNTLVNDIYESRLKEQQLRAEVQQAQIEALQMQINPHFLFNTLDSINWMALLDNNENIAHMAQSLGDFLRFNVTLDNMYCTVLEEVQNTRHFMHIQQVRFEPRFSFRFKVASQVHGCRVIKLLLQPIVENSIKHGIEPLERCCEVLVQIDTNGEKLCIKVEDNGSGMPDASVSQLNLMWQQTGHYQANNSRVGLSNLMKRLYLCYGDAAYFHIESCVGKGTRTLVHLPLQYAENEEASAQLPNNNNPF